jgi:hypothetical protein
MRSSPAPLSVVPPSNVTPPDAPHVSWPPPAGGSAVTGRELAERIARFYAAHPDGRIVTTLVTRAREAVVFRAAVYRRAEDAEPAATGWAASGWSLGPGFERAEEAAVGRALAHLGVAIASEPRRGTESAEAAPRSVAAVGDIPDSADSARRALVADLGVLVTRAERYGLRARRAAAWRARLRAGGDATEALHAAEQRLRAWVERRRAEPYAGAF